MENGIDEFILKNKIKINNEEYIKMSDFYLFLHVMELIKEKNIFVYEKKFEKAVMWRDKIRHALKKEVYPNNIIEDIKNQLNKMTEERELSNKEMDELMLKYKDEGYSDPEALGKAIGEQLINFLKKNKNDKS